MITIKNNDIKVAFNETTGKIESLVYENRDFINGAQPVFEMALRFTTAEQKIINASDFSLKKSNSTENAFECEYDNSGMTVSISAEIDDKISWNISVKNKSKEIIEWVNYPNIVVANDLKDNNGNSKILWGFNEGTLIDDMAMREHGWGYIEPKFPGTGLMGIFPAIVQTQFMSYYNDESGLYFASHDNKSNLKGIDFYCVDDGIKLQFRHFTGTDFGCDYKMPYPMVMDFFKGDWHDAAQIYRTWFEENKDDEFVPITENKKLPKWYGESPVVVTYPVRGNFDSDVMNPNKLFPYTNAMKHIERLEQAFDSKILVLLMHWEGSAPWAPPIVWPPYGGEEELKKFIDALHERGDVLGVYCSGLGWSIQSNLVKEYNTKERFDKENLKSAMCLSPKQELLPSEICPVQRSGYDMCPTQKFTQDIIADQVNKMVESGIDYIQLLDQNHGGTSYFCFSKSHGHPPVPGKWQVDAVKKLLSNAQKNAGKVLFGCESAAAESYIPYLLFSDNRYNLCYNIGNPVPAYAYIYHRYLNNFMGNQVCVNEWFDHDKSPDNFLMRAAYAFCAGDMLTVVLNQDGKFIFNWGFLDYDNIPEQESIENLIRNLNYWRKGYGKKYIHSGDMIKPYNIICGKNTVYGSNGFDREVDKLFTCAWKSYDKHEAQFIVNYNREAAKCILELPDNTEFNLYENYDNIKLINGGKVELTINPLCAIMIESEVNKDDVR